MRKSRNFFLYSNPVAKVKTRISENPAVLSADRMKDDKRNL